MINLKPKDIKNKEKILEGNLEKVTGASNNTAIQKITVKEDTKDLSKESYKLYQLNNLCVAYLYHLKWSSLLPDKLKNKYSSITLVDYLDIEESKYNLFKKILDNKIYEKINLDFELSVIDNNLNKKKLNIIDIIYLTEDSCIIKENEVNIILYLINFHNDFKNLKNYKLKILYMNNNIKEYSYNELINSYNTMDNKYVFNKFKNTNKACYKCQFYNIC